MSDVLQWSKEIELAVKKHAFDKSKDVQQDLIQECYLTLLEEKFVDGPGHAYTICEHRVLHLLGRKPKVEKLEVALTPEVVRIADDRTAANWSDPAFRMDSEAATKAVEKLPQIERFVIIWLFGLNGEDAQTEEEVASRVKKNRAWVRKTKETAIQKLRSILGAKNGS